MKNTELVEHGANLKVVAAVIDALRKETSGMLDDETRDLFSRLSSGLRRCARARAGD